MEGKLKLAQVRCLPKTPQGVSGKMQIKIGVFLILAVMVFFTVPEHTDFRSVLTSKYILRVKEKKAI